MDYTSLSIQQLQQGYQSQQFSVQEVCQFYLDKAQKLNPQLNAIVHFNEKFMEQACHLDKKNKPQGALFGVPVAVKDNFCTKGLPTTAASKILHNFTPPYTAFCIEELEKQGALILGKTNLDEFAMGSSNENSSLGPCHNPWNSERVPGGSSGGSAAATAAGIAPLSIGSDTGGSIRQPANFCGVVGIKPTYGSISRYGMIAFASSLDQAGPMACDVASAALALDVMIKKDKRDATNVHRTQESLQNLNAVDLKNMTVGLPKEYFASEIEGSARSAIESVIKELKKQNCQIRETSLPHTEFAIPVYYLIAASEASSNLSRYDGVRYGLRDIKTDGTRSVKDLREFYKLTRTRGFGEEVQRRILLGTFALSSGYHEAYYKKACQVRRLISEDFSQAFKECDLIIGPVTTESAFRLNEKVSDPIAMYYNDILTTPANLAGLPAMSLPIGLDKNKMPVGLQIMAPAFCEKTMLEFALSVESLVQFNEVPDVG